MLAVRANAGSPDAMWQPGGLARALCESNTSDFDWKSVIPSLAKSHTHSTVSVPDDTAPQSGRDFQTVDLSQHPRFLNATRKSAIRAHLEPGSALFIPAWWTHAVISSVGGCSTGDPGGANIAVNYWWPSESLPGVDSTTTSTSADASTS